MKHGLHTILTPAIQSAFFSMLHILMCFLPPGGNKIQ